jgi:hypothetical protein
MRDPGTPRRNPFFDRDSDAPSDDPGMGWRDAWRDVESDPSAPGVDEPVGGVGGFATLLALVEGLGEAQPEAAEHLVAAAHEVVLTVKVLVDATEAVLAQQRAAMAQRNTERVSEDEHGDDATVTPVSVLRRTEGS